MNTINTCWLEISIGRTVRAKPTVSIGSCQNIRVFYDIPIDSLVWSEVFMFATSQLLDHNIRRIHSSHFDWIVERKTRVTQMVCCLPESSWKQKKIDQVFEHICYTINSVLFIRMFKFVWFDLVFLTHIPYRYFRSYRVRNSWEHMIRNSFSIWVCHICNGRPSHVTTMKQWFECQLGFFQEFRAINNKLTRG